jgi:protein-S-isoprenylcysteine O-methyltransferase Ste14
MRKGPLDYLYVGIQILLFAGMAFPLWPMPNSWKEIVALPALVLMPTGAFVAISALFTLNKNLSVFPTPLTHGQLIQTGLYKYIRHPIYTGLLFLAFGWALYHASFFLVLMAACLLALFFFKASYEEKRLLKQFSTYAQYQSKTGMFLP